MQKGSTSMSCSLECPTLMGACSRLRRTAQISLFWILVLQTILATLLNQISAHDGHSPACGEVITSGVSSEESDIIVTVHNEFRQKVASGLEKDGSPGPQPPASDMLEMSWDEELATMAQRWANHCEFKFDKGRSVVRFRVGQNLYILRSRKGYNSKPDWKRAIGSWYEEVKMYDPSNVPMFKKNNTTTGHYTALVWAKSYKIGCGFTSYRNSFESGKRNDLQYKMLYVCNYGPAGNVLMEPVYTVGTACTDCPGACSVAFPSLCVSDHDKKKHRHSHHHSKKPKKKDKKRKKSGKAKKEEDDPERDEIVSVAQVGKRKVSQMSGGGKKSGDLMGIVNRILSIQDNFPIPYSLGGLNDIIRLKEADLV